MNHVSEARPPRWYWVVSVIALAWMLFGVFAWFMDLLMAEDTLMQMSEAQRELFLTRPQWIFGLYAIAIFTGLAGAIGLLLRRSWAIPAFWVSLLTAIVQFAYVLFVMNAIAAIGAAAALPFPLLVLAIGMALLWFSMYARGQGWLGVGETGSSLH